MFATSVAGVVSVPSNLAFLANVLGDAIVGDVVEYRTKGVLAIFMVLSCFEIKKAPFLQCMFRFHNGLHETMMIRGFVLSTDLAIHHAAFVFHSFHVAFIHMKTTVLATPKSETIKYITVNTKQKTNLPLT